MGLDIFFSCFGCFFGPGAGNFRFFSGLFRPGSGLPDFI
jgi:hypothetical protein